jgi:hypothetical protein
VPVKPAQPLNDWCIKIYWLNNNAKKPYGGCCNPFKKQILIAINKNNVYPLTEKFAVGTEQTLYGFKYVFETLTFNNPKELIRFIFLHEFSHLLDYMQRFSLRYKQTKANRFAIKHFKKGEDNAKRNC